MAFTNTKAAANTGVLHDNKISQTQTCRPPDRFGMRRSERKDSAFVDNLIQPIAKEQSLPQPRLILEENSFKFTNKL